METRKFKIYVTERSTKDGRKFNAYHTFSKNDRRTEVKFNRDVKELPSKTCYVEVEETKCNLNTSGEYPVLYIKEIIKIESLAAGNIEANRNKIKDYFG